MVPIIYTTFKRQMTKPETYFCAALYIYNPAQMRIHNSFIENIIMLLLFRYVHVDVNQNSVFN